MLKDHSKSIRLDRALLARKFIDIKWDGVSQQINLSKESESSADWHSDYGIKHLFLSSMDDE